MWLNDWEWECCGDHFEVDSEVEWDVMPLQREEWAHLEPLGDPDAGFADLPEIIEVASASDVAAALPQVGVPRDEAEASHRHFARGVRRIGRSR